MFVCLGLGVVVTQSIFHNWKRKICQTVSASTLQLRPKTQDPTFLKRAPSSCTNLLQKIIKVTDPTIVFSLMANLPDLIPTLCATTDGIGILTNLLPLLQWHAELVQALPLHFKPETRLLKPKRLKQLPLPPQSAVRREECGP